MKTKKAPPRKKAPPVEFTKKLAAEICERISTGEPLAQICRDAHMPSDRAVRYWGDPTSQEYKGDEFAQSLALARRNGFDAIAEDCILIADTPMEGVEFTTDDKGGTSEKRADMLGHRKLRIETRLKLLAKWDPKRYGEKQQIEHGGIGGGPVQMTITKTESDL